MTRNQKPETRNHEQKTFTIKNMSLKSYKITNIAKEMITRKVWVFRSIDNYRKYIIHHFPLSMF